MTVRRSWTIAVRSALVGLLFAVALSGDELISAQVWIAASAMAAVGMVLVDFVTAAALARSRTAVAWRRRRKPPDVPTFAGLQTVNVLLSNATSNPRAHANHLRPRLEELAAHYMPVRRGIDFANDRTAAASLLGDVAWMIDPTVTERTPTIAEIDRFLDIMLGEDQVTT